jgi:hypothetical protein
VVSGMECLPVDRSFGNVHTQLQWRGANITAQQQPLTSVLDVSLL